jgi:protein SCO1
MRFLPTLVVLACVCSGCARERSYEMRGQILAVDRARNELTVRHEDIPGVMSGMTMAFEVEDAKLLEGRSPGDMIRATLVVKDDRGYLSRVEVTGRAPIVNPPALPPRMEVLQPGEAVPDAAFRDQTGARRRLADWRGKVLAVTFIYTRCPLPDFCPLMDKQFAELQRAASEDERLRDAYHLASVSFDPAFDTPAVLLEHAKRAGARPETWSFLTGDVGEIDRFASRFGVAVMREGSEPGQIVHNLRTGIVDPDGRFVNAFSGNDWKPSELVEEMRRALGER